MERVKDVVSGFESLSEKCLYFASLAIIFVAAVQICDGATLRWQHEFTSERCSPSTKVTQENLTASNQASSSSIFENFFSRQKSSSSQGLVPVAYRPPSSGKIDVAKSMSKNSMKNQQQKQLLELNPSFIETIVWRLCWNVKCHIYFSVSVYCRKRIIYNKNS